MGGPHSLTDQPGNREHVVLGQGAMLLNECSEIVAGEVIHDDVGSGSVERIGELAIVYADDGGMAEVSQEPRFAEDVGHVAFHRAVVQGLDHHLGVEIAIVTEKRRAETAGAENSPRLIAMQRKRGEARRIERGGLLDRGQRGVPFLLFQRGPVGVELRRRLSRGIVNRFRDGDEGLPGAIEVGAAELQLAEAVEQGRGLPLLLGGKLPEAGQQL